MWLQWTNTHKKFIICGEANEIGENRLVRIHDTKYGMFAICSPAGIGGQQFGWQKMKEVVVVIQGSAERCAWSAEEPSLVKVLKAGWMLYDIVRIHCIRDAIKGGTGPTPKVLKVACDGLSNVWSVAFGGCCLVGVAGRCRAVGVVWLVSLAGVVWLVAFGAVWSVSFGWCHLVNVVWSVSPGGCRLVGVVWSVSFWAVSFGGCRLGGVVGGCRMVDVVWWVLLVGVVWWVSK